VISIVKLFVVLAGIQVDHTELKSKATQVFQILSDFSQDLSVISVMILAPLVQDIHLFCSVEVNIFNVILQLSVLFAYLLQSVDGLFKSTDTFFILSQ
jgi:hypothetical protein